MFYTIGAVSVKRIKELIREITNVILNISAGAIYSFCRKLSHWAKSPPRQITRSMWAKAVETAKRRVVSVLETLIAGA